PAGATPTPAPGFSPCSLRATGPFYRGGDGFAPPQSFAGQGHRGLRAVAQEVAPVQPGRRHASGAAAAEEVSDQVAGLRAGAHDALDQRDRLLGGPAGALGGLRVDGRDVGPHVAVHVALGLREKAHQARPAAAREPDAVGAKSGVDALLRPDPVLAGRGRDHAVAEASRRAGAVLNQRHQLIATAGCRVALAVVRADISRVERCVLVRVAEAVRARVPEDGVVYAREAGGLRFLDPDLEPHDLAAEMVAAEDAIELDLDVMRGILIEVHEQRAVRSQGAPQLD